MPPFLYILLRFSLGHNTLSIFLYYLLFWKKNLLPPYWYKVSQKLYANTYDTKTCDRSWMSHHIMLQISLNYPRSFPNLLRSDLQLT